MSSRAYSFCLFLILLVPALWNLSGSEIADWDEGLAVRHARNALQNNVWLVPTQESGGFSRAYSKPPFLLWQIAAGIKLFGVSPWGMRIGTALALVLSALVARQLARRIGLHEAVASVWALLIVVCGGALKWARFVNIEITLVLFNLLALYCYARAFQDSQRWVRWAVLSATALCGAFLTKQLVCALAAVPLVLLEVFLYDHQLRRRAYARLALTGCIAVVVAGAWWMYAAAQSNGRVADSMVEFTLVQRVKGLPGGQHINYLNRIANEVREGLDPIALEVCVLGWGLLLFRRLRDNNPTLWLVLLNLAISLIVFGFVSRSILPWYAWSIIVPLLLGSAYVLGEGLRESWAWGVRVIDDPHKPFGRPSLELGVLALVVGGGVLSLTEERMEQFSWILATLLLFFGGVWALRRSSLKGVRVALVSLLFVWPTGSWAYGLSLRDAYHQDPGPLLALAAPLADANATRVAVEQNLAGGKNRYRAVFGPQAKAERRAPWLSKPAKVPFQAYVEQGQLPREYTPPKGLQLERSAGLLAWIGDVSTQPYDANTLNELLSDGSITYEAEWGTSGIDTSLGWREGQRVRGATDLDATRYRTKAVRLVEVTTTQLPKGKYSFGVRYDADCSRVRRTPSGRVEINGGGRSLKRFTLQCKADGLAVKSTSFELNRPSAVEIIVRYQSGGLWVDNLTIERQKPTKRRKPKKKKK